MSREDAAVEDYGQEVDAWVANAIQEFSVGDSPSPFPKVPTRINAEGDDTGEALIPTPSVPFQWVETKREDGLYYLSISVPLPGMLKSST